MYDDNDKFSCTTLKETFGKEFCDFNNCPLKKIIIEGKERQEHKTEKELLESAEKAISESTISEDINENLKTVKRLISGFVALPKSEMMLLISHSIKSKFGLKNDDIGILKAYYKEQNEKRLEILMKEEDGEEPFIEEDPFNVDIDELDQPEEAIRAAEEDAKNILSEGDPINYILETVGKKHTGDEKTQEGIAVSIAGQSCANTAGLQISVNGDSGSGKSHSLKSHLQLVPNAFKRETSLSAKAAYYMKMKPGLILFSDDKDPDEASEEVIKRATTKYQEYTVHTTVNDQETKTVTIPPRINWYLTSVQSNVSDQLLSRQLIFSTDTSDEQKNKIFEMQKAEGFAGELFILEVTKEVLTCRRIYSDIKSHLFKVKIPFIDRIEIKDKSNSRLFPMFLDMIKGYSIFKYQQRETDSDGYILANMEDFQRAKNLFESQRESLVSKLSERERKIVQYIAQHPAGCNTNEIAIGTKQSYKTVYNMLNGRKDREYSGLLNKFKGLTMIEQNTSSEEREGIRVGRKEKIFRIENVDTWALFDAEFIELKKE